MKPLLLYSKQNIKIVIFVRFRKLKYLLFFFVLKYFNFLFILCIFEDTIILKYNLKIDRGFPKPPMYFKYFCIHLIFTPMS